MLQHKKLWILDMDGTVYLGNRLFPETLPFLRRIEQTGARHLFFTNNASRAKDTYVRRLNAMGIPARPETILTSAETTIAFLQRHRAGMPVNRYTYRILCAALKRRAFAWPIRRPLWW